MVKVFRIYCAQLIEYMFELFNIVLLFSPSRFVRLIIISSFFANVCFQLKRAENASVIQAIAHYIKKNSRDVIQRL